LAAPVAVGLCRNDAHEYFVDGDGPLVSITTAIRAVDKSGPLMGWAKRLTAEAAVRNLDMVRRMVDEGGEKAAVEFLKRLAEHKRDKAADIGTRVHALAEAIARKQPVQINDDEQPYVDAYMAWLRDFRPEFIAAEYMVANLTHRYAGTGDAVVLMGGARFRLDTKTTAVTDGRVNGPYSETALQLAAANYAEFAGRPGDPKRYSVPRADYHAVLHLRSDGTYAVVPYDVTPDTFEAFLAALRLWRWLQGPAKSVVGQALQLREKAA
jgi:hypothetical protein